MNGKTSHITIDLNEERHILSPERLRLVWGGFRPNFISTDTNVVEVRYLNESPVSSGAWILGKQTGEADLILINAYSKTTNGTTNHPRIHVVVKSKNLGIK